MTIIDFGGQVAIITGAGRGTGRAMALLLGERGAKVVVNVYGGDIAGNAGSSRVAAEVAEEICAAGGCAIACGIAVGTQRRRNTLFKRAIDAYGRVDVLINNAGVTSNGPIDEADQGQLDRVIDVNYRGGYALMRAVWPIMKRLLTIPS